MSRPPAPSRPRASIPRMLVSPFLRLARRVGVSPSLPSNPSSSFILILTSSLRRLDLSRDPRKTLARLASHKFTIANSFPLIFMLLFALYDLYNMSASLFVLRLGIPLAYTIAVLIPLTSQFVWPATPIFSWLLTFFTARFMPAQHRPNIHVALLPALESVLYGANISDLQTRYTNPVLDIIAWLPYGVLHYTLPFVVALLLWTLGPKGAVQYWGKAFGWMNLLGVITQLFFPCAAPWYEIIHGLTPANYAMPGSPGGLMRIDKIFHSSGYTNAFGASPLVFGAFPSLHSGCAVMEALFLSHFFPRFKPFFWCYVGVLWWATMYLSHHYLIDLTGGACLSVGIFYATMPDLFKDVDQINWGSGEGYESVVNGNAKEVDLDEEIRRLEEEGEGDHDAREDEESRVEAGGSGSVGPNKAKRTVSWGETIVMGEDGGRSG